jgi:hypothetical protein
MSVAWDELDIGTVTLRPYDVERVATELTGIGDPALGDTVAAIAARWGFAHVGRFGTTYRQAHQRTSSGEADCCTDTDID